MSTINSYLKLLKQLSDNGPTKNINQINWSNNTSLFNDPFINDYRKRQQFVKKYSWAIPSNKIINLIINFIKTYKCKSIISIGSGMGLWEHLINLKAKSEKILLEIIAIDNKKYNKLYYHIQEMDAKHAIQKYKNNNILFLCWPNYNCPVAYDSLSKFAGNYCIYIGEGPGGCTGDDTFHQELEKNWNLCNVEIMIQWIGIHDQIFFYLRK